MERLVLNINDAPVNPPSLPSAQNLSVLLGTDRFFFMLASSDGVVLAQRSYLFPNETQPQRMVKQWDAIFAKDDLINQPYRQIKLAIGGYRSVLMPDAVFDAHFAEQYLKSVVALQNSEQIGIDTLHPIQARHLYPIHDAVLEWVSRAFPNALLLHQGTAVMLGALRQLRNLADFVLVCVHPTTMQLVVCKQGALILYNTYAYSVPKEFLYFTLLAYQQSGHSTAHIPLIVSGSLLRESLIFKELAYYITTIHFADRPDDYQFSPNFERAIPHFYFDLYHLHLCE